MILLMLALLVSLPSGRQDRVSVQDAKAKLAEAAEEYRQGHFREAEQAYEQILALWPGLPQGLVGLGKCRIAQGRPQESVAPLSEAVRREPSDREAMRTLARAFVELNRFTPAEQLLTKLVTSDAKDKETWYYLGELMYQNGYYGAALVDLEKSSDPEAGSVRKAKTEVHRAVCLAKVGQTQQAEAAMSALLGNMAAHADPDFLLTFAQLFYDTQRPQLALERVDEALAANPTSAMVYFWRAKVLYRLNRVDDSAKAAEESIHLLPQLPFPHYLLVKIYQAQGRVAEAKEQAEWLRAYEDRKSVTEPK